MCVYHQLEICFFRCVSISKPIKWGRMTFSNRNKCNLLSFSIYARQSYGVSFQNVAQPKLKDKNRQKTRMIGARVRAFCHFAEPNSVLLWCERIATRIWWMMDLVWRVAQDTRCVTITPLNERHSNRHAKPLAGFWKCSIKSITLNISVLFGSFLLFFWYFEWVCRACVFVERRPDPYAFKTHKFSVNNWFCENWWQSRLIYLRQIHAEFIWKLALQNRLCRDK